MIKLTHPTFSWLAVTLTATGLAAQATTDKGNERGELDARRLDNWQQWRGPLGTGVAPRGNPPLEWSESKNVRWKVAIPGEGHSSPIVWDDRVLVLTAVRTDRRTESPAKPDADARTSPPEHFYRFLTLALDRQTGKTLWERTSCEEVPREGRHETNSYASASPVTDGRLVHAFFGSRGLYCYTLEGELKWKKSLGQMRTRRGWGEGATPALHRDVLVVPWDQEANSFITGLDANTGEMKWKVDRNELTSWATPIVVEVGGRAQAIVNATNKVCAYDLQTGEVIWQCGGQTVNAIPSPVAGDDYVICMSGYRGAACLAIGLDARGDVTGTDKVRWSLNRGMPYVPSPLLYEDQLYFTQTNSNVLTGVEARTGKVRISSERLPGLQDLYASPVGAAGRVYFTARDGTVIVIRHNAPLEVLATNRLDDPIDASPAIVGKQLFLRGSRHLYCIENAEK